MAIVFRWCVRGVGLALVVVALVPYWQALRALDQRDYVSALLAGFVGWFVSHAGLELVRPETAE
ncbi:MAG: hypothetical protein Q7V43_08070 [Myxococcales bacterium]|nr:hypothetical protein [Myxococcales bacterium]